MSSRPTWKWTCRFGKLHRRCSFWHQLAKTWMLRATWPAPWLPSQAGGPCQLYVPRACFSGHQASSITQVPGKHIAMPDKTLLTLESALPVVLSRAELKTLLTGCSDDADCRHRGEQQVTHCCRIAALSSPELHCGLAMRTDGRQGSALHFILLGCSS